MLAAAVVIAALICAAIVVFVVFGGGGPRPPTPAPTQGGQAPTAAPLAGRTCSLLSGFDAGAQNQNMSTVPSTTGAQGCCLPCQQLEGCAGAVYFEGNCYLKNAANATPFPSEGCTFVSAKQSPIYECSRALCNGKTCQEAIDACCSDNACGSSRQAVLSHVLASCPTCSACTIASVPTQCGQRPPPVGGPYVSIFSPDPKDYDLNIAGVGPEYVPVVGDYLMLLGDWGDVAGSWPNSAGLSQSCQQQIGAKMQAFQARAGKQRPPLAIVTLGDNFYGDGEPGWVNWKQMYGSLTELPWIISLGNHDYGVGNPCYLCPDSSSCAGGSKWCSLESAQNGYVSSADCAPCAAGSQGCQAYQGTELSYGKVLDGGASRGLSASQLKAWHCPDKNFFVTLPAGDACVVEIISLDLNNGDTGGWGGNQGSGAQRCDGGGAEANSRTAYVGDAAFALLKQRAQNSVAKIVLIIQHYPGQAANLRQTFLSNSQPSREGKFVVICAFGHTHQQECTGGGNAPESCLQIMSGSGGGCCVGLSADVAGFAVLDITGPGDPPTFQVLGIAGTDTSLTAPDAGCAHEGVSLDAYRHARVEPYQG